MIFRPKALLVKYLFHPVGQGLMASGRIRVAWPLSKRPVFSWVYDCGTHSERKLLDREIDELSTSLTPSSGELDLVVISHLDIDHVNGLDRLLSVFKVKTLVLPFLTLAQRMVLLMHHKRYVNKSMLVYWTDPVGALLGANGNAQRIGQIVLVPPSGDNGPPTVLGDDVPVPPDTEAADDDGPWTLVGDLVRDDKDIESEELRAEVARDPRVYMLKPGGRLTAGIYWEFVPYFDPTIPKIPGSQFLADVTMLRKELLAAANLDDRARAVRKIKSKYEEHFTTKKQRNDISLFLYSGPCFWPSWHKRYMRGFARGFRWSESSRSLLSTLSALRRPLLERHFLRHYFWRRDRFSALYTGDGRLDSHEKLDLMLNYFGEARIQRPAVLQVMHHGSRNNWFDGFSEKIRPEFSVFSSDPKHARYKHPHKVVWNDLARYSRARQVDKQYGMAVATWLEA